MSLFAIEIAANGKKNRNQLHYYSDNLNLIECDKIDEFKDLPRFNAIAAILNACHVVLNYFETESRICNQPQNLKLRI